MASRPIKVRPVLFCLLYFLPITEPHLLLFPREAPFPTALCLWAERMMKNLDFSGILTVTMRLGFHNHHSALKLPGVPHHLGQILALA